MKKLLLFLMLLLWNIKLVQANYRINIDLSNSAFKMNQQSMKQEITPKDELVYDLYYQNKQDETLKIYLTLKHDQSKLLDKIKVQLFYQNNMIYENSANQIIESQYISTLKVNHQDHLQIRLLFDENSNNKYTMQEANLYLSLVTYYLDDIQTGDAFKMIDYLGLLLISSLVISICIKRSNIK